MHFIEINQQQWYLIQCWLFWGLSFIIKINQQSTHIMTNVTCRIYVLYGYQMNLSIISNNT